MKEQLSIIGSVCAFAWLTLATGAMGLTNAGFDSGLRNWKAAWHVASVAGEAVLNDVQERHAFLFQADEIGAGSFQVEFDFAGGLSSEVPAGAFLDSFYASLYFVDELSTFITEHDYFDASHGLFDLDANGAFHVEGTISDSPKGEGWMHFSGTFTSSSAYTIVVFELYDLNFTNGDSEVRVDNVFIGAGEP